MQKRKTDCIHPKNRTPVVNLRGQGHMVYV